MTLFGFSIFESLSTPESLCFNWILHNIYNLGQFYALPIVFSQLRMTCPFLQPRTKYLEQNLVKSDKARKV